MNQLKFIEISHWTKEKLWLHCKTITKKYGHIAALNILMTLRYDLQKELSKYSKDKDILDKTQENCLVITELLAKWCGQYYKLWAMKEILNSMPNLISKPQKLKGLTNQAWENYVRSNYSY